MNWTKCSFINAVGLMVEAFASSPDYETLALVWREGNEYRVMSSWEVRMIRNELREDLLRVVLWLERAEAGILKSPSVGPGT